jgi:hypothetical protein
MTLPKILRRLALALCLSAGAPVDGHAWDGAADADCLSASAAAVDLVSVDPTAPLGECLAREAFTDLVVERVRGAQERRVPAHLRAAPHTQAALQRRLSRVRTGRRFTPVCTPHLAGFAAWGSGTPPPVIQH